MGKFLCMGAMLQCSFGMAPSQLMVTDPTRPLLDNKPQANMMDFAPMVNVLPFGMCQSLANPTVASATTAAMGVLTPMPCVPVITAPWAPCSQALVSNMPGVMDNGKLICAWGGNISVTYAGQIMAEGK